MSSIASYFSDPLDPARSLQLNNRYWKNEKFQHLEVLRDADENLNQRKFGSLRKTLKHVKALFPASYHHALLRRIAYSMTYQVAFEPIRFSIKLSQAFLDANKYCGNDSVAYMSGQRVEEIRHIVSLAHSIYRDHYGSDMLYSNFAVRYANSANARVREDNRHGEFSDFHFDELSDFTCIIYLCETTRQNGCFSYIDGTNSMRKSHLLRALHGVVGIEMGLNGPEQMSQLPLELRGNLGTGKFLDDGKYARLAAAKVDVVGGVGDGVIFNGFETLHRGGKPMEGERLSFFISTGGRVRMRAKRVASQLLAYLWL